MIVPTDVNRYNAHGPLLLAGGLQGLQSRLFNRQGRQERQGNAGNGHFLGVFLGVLGVLGGSLYPKRLCSSPGSPWGW